MRGGQIPGLERRETWGTRVGSIDLAYTPHKFKIAEIFPMSVIRTMHWTVKDWAFIVGLG